MTKIKKTAYLMVTDNETGTAGIQKIEGETLIGSGEECDIRLDDDDVPRQFMRILALGNALLVRRKINDDGTIDSGYVGLAEDNYRVPAQNPIYVSERFTFQQLEEDSTQEIDQANLAISNDDEKEEHEIINEKYQNTLLAVRNMETDQDRFFKLTEESLLIGSGEECKVRCEGLPRQAFRLLQIGESIWLRRKQDENGMIAPDNIGFGEDDYLMENRWFEEGKWYFQPVPSYPTNIQDFNLAGGDDFNP